MSDIEQVGTNTPDGTLLGLLSTDKIGFYGTTPVVRSSTGTLATTAPTSTNPYGFTAAQAQTLLNIGLACKANGIVA
jgi:hypothetical protein